MGSPASDNSNSKPESDSRISHYIAVTEELKRGNYNVSVPATPTDQVGRLGKSIQELAQVLEVRYQQLHKLANLTADINAGLLLDNILDKVYDNFFEFIPYNRIGFSLLEDTERGKVVRAYWARTDLPAVKLPKGYSAPLAGSSLENIIRTGEPRIINDLEDYLRHKPESDSTRLIVAEGLRASLTCPLVANGVPVGFMFFSSVRPGMYADMHVDIFQSISGQLAVILEKGRLVTELAAQKGEIEAQYEELRQLNELKNKFLGMAAHDLRGPLGNIRLSATLLSEYRQDLDEDEAGGILGDIVGQANYMLALINDLLDVAKIENGNLQLNLASLSLNAFLQEAMTRHNQIAAGKNSTVVLESAPVTNFKVDAVKLRQVVDNLISNAIKFSPPGSTIRVSTRELATGWRINVLDQGPGILPADRQKLFQEFARLSARPTGGEDSTGLGLAISRRIVEAHGGEIGVDSEPGHGANFWFTLPRKLIDYRKLPEQHV
ncbi:MAG: hypothetical protein Kow0031_37350 [Anaerolineae bacterium]